MSHALGTLFPIPTVVSGSIDQLSSSSSAAASNTKATVSALAGSAARRFTPEATVTATVAVPGAPATFSNVGWQASLGAEPGTMLAGSLTFQALINLSQTMGTGTQTITTILYINSTELARGSVTQALVAGDNTLTYSITWSNTTFPANSVLNMEVYYLGPTVNLAASTTTITMKYTATGTQIGSGLAYTVQAVRSTSDTAAATDSNARAVTAFRSESDTAAAVDAGTRLTSYFRSEADSAPATDAVARVASHPRSLADNAALVDALSRAFTGTRALTDTAAATDAAIRAITYGRYLQDGGDYIVRFATKSISGVTRDLAGNIFPAATVLLMRESDNFFCQQTTSDGSGNYSFPRDLFDPYTYYVIAYRPGSLPQLHGVSDRGLVPV